MQDGGSSGVLYHFCITQEFRVMLEVEQVRTNWAGLCLSYIGSKLRDYYSNDFAVVDRSTLHGTKNGVGYHNRNSDRLFQIQDRDQKF